MPYRRLIIAFALATSAGATYASCESIKDSKKRLICYDNGVARASELKTKEEQQEKAKRMDGYLHEAKTALRSLQKMRSRIETGISYREYFQPLSDIKYEIDQFTSSDAGKALPEVSKNFNAALDHFLFAGEVWRTKFSTGRVADGLKRFEAPYVYDKLVDSYQLSDMIVNNFLGSHNVGILYSSALQIIWLNAGRAITNAESTIKSGGKFLEEKAVSSDAEENLNNKKSTPIWE